MSEHGSETSNVDPAGRSALGLAESMRNNAPKVDNLAWLDEEFLNGECFIAGELGEREEYKGNRVVVCPSGYTYAQQPLQQVAFTVAAFKDIVQANAVHAFRTDSRLDAKTAWKIAFLRAFALRDGLMSPDFDEEKYHCIVNDVFESHEIDLDSDDFVREATIDTIASGALRKEEVEKLRDNFYNIVCCVAFVFRVRGHHWLEPLNRLYENLWQKCLKNETDPGLSWEFIAHNALHGIFPCVLDDFWTDCVKEGKIAGALCKRYDSPPAGVAAIRSVAAGALDLLMVVPGLKDRFKSAFDYLDDMIQQLRANRWAGSVNRKLYNAPALAFDEARFAAIASVVISSLQAFAPDSPLLASPSLKRVANNARITGGVVARGIAVAASDPAIVKNMLAFGGERGG